MHPSEMHPSYVRLMEAAKKATAGTSQPISRPSQLARAMNESPQRIHNWQERGVSKEGAIKAEKLYGVSVNHILEGGTAATQRSAGASNEPAQPDTPEKQGGLALNEFLNYLNARHPRAPLTPDEVIEEAEAYREYVAQRLARRLLKRDFQAPEPVPDARVEAAFAEAQRRERAAQEPEQQLIDNPLKARAQKRSTGKKAGSQ
jgi:hypothetical protein